MYAAGYKKRTASLETEGEFSRNRGSAQKGKIVDTKMCPIFSKLVYHF